MDNHSKSWHLIHERKLIRKQAKKKKREINRKKKEKKKIGSIIILPEHICLFNPKPKARRYFINSLNELNKLPNNALVTINFTKVVQIYPCGAVALFATIDRLRSSGRRVLASGYKKNNKTHQVLQQIGLLEIVNSDLPKVDIDRPDVAYWSMDKGCLLYTSDAADE